jgi:YidC/Oxa1 family membrane protein insertase
MGSTFISIRSMCKLPVESFHTGGILWFQDLTLTDPYYILPLISTATLFVMIKVMN